MHDAFEFAIPTAQLVRHVQPLRRVGDDAHRHLGGNGATFGSLAEQGLERLALDPLHREPQHPFVLVDLVHPHDVVVLDAADQLSFLQEHGPKVRVCRELGSHHLDCDQAFLAARA